MCNVQVTLIIIGTLLRGLIIAEIFEGETFFLSRKKPQRYILNLCEQVRKPIQGKLCTHGHCVHLDPDTNRIFENGSREKQDRNEYILSIYGEGAYQPPRNTKTACVCPRKYVGKMCYSLHPCFTNKYIAFPNRAMHDEGWEERHDYYTPHRIGECFEKCTLDYPNCMSVTVSRAGHFCLLNDISWASFPEHFHMHHGFTHYEIINVGPCMNGGTCVKLARWPYFKCNCLESYTGDVCDSRVHCRPGSCLNLGVCNSITGLCDCQPGWTGVSCEQEIAVCSPNPCNNNGRCVSIGVGQYQCSCQPPWTGTRCEIFATTPDDQHVLTRKPRVSERGELARKLTIAGISAACFLVIAFYNIGNCGYWVSKFQQRTALQKEIAESPPIAELPPPPTKEASEEGEQDINEAIRRTKLRLERKRKRRHQS